MRTVFKYRLSGDGWTTLNGGRPRVVHVGVDPAGEPWQPCAWVELDPEGLTRMRLTYVGTGHDVPAECSHVGSVVTSVGLVWHVYEDDGPF